MRVERAPLSRRANLGYVLRCFSSGESEVHFGTHLFGDFHAKIDNWVEDIDFGIRNINSDIGEAKAFCFPVKPDCFGRRFTQGSDMIGWPAHSNPGWTSAETSEFIPFGQLTFKLNLHINLHLRAGLKPNRKTARLKPLN